MNWNPREIRRQLEGGAPVYLPVNPVEYHGPHLSLHNDHLVSVGLARDVHEHLQNRLGALPFLFAQDLGVGVDPCPGPGSVYSGYGEVRRRVVEACLRLAELGAQRVVLITFHGSPLHSHAVFAGVRALEARGVRAIAPLTLAIEQQMQGQLRGVEDAWLPVRDPVARAALQAEMQTDFHAGFIETSLALHYAPEHVHGHRDVRPCPPPEAARGPAALAAIAGKLGFERLELELELVARGLGWYAMRPFPGYCGRPDLANPDSGAVFARAMVDAFSTEALAVFEDGAPPPRPPMAWLPGASLGGWLGTVKIPLEDIDGG